MLSASLLLALTMACRNIPFTILVQKSPERQHDNVTKSRSGSTCGGNQNIKMVYT